METKAQQNYTEDTPGQMSGIFIYDTSCVYCSFYYLSRLHACL